MHELNGGCHCGNISLQAEFTLPANAINPRACDCELCRKHGAAYISDAMGKLLVRVEDLKKIQWYRHGNRIADFLLCIECGVLIGAFYEGDGGLHAAVNAKSVHALFGAEQLVSPKKLSAAEKAQRWSDIWFHNVQIIPNAD